MEKTEQNRIWMFFHDLTVFTGLLSYVVMGLIGAGVYQLQWQKVGSDYMAQINSVDIDKIAKEAAEQGLEAGEYKVVSGGKIVKNTEK